MSTSEEGASTPAVVELEGMSELDWDDSMLLDIFKETVNSHRTVEQGDSRRRDRKKGIADNRKSAQKAAATNDESLDTTKKAVPGEWKPVMTEADPPGAEHSSSASILNERAHSEEESLTQTAHVDAYGGSGSASSSGLDGKIAEAHAAMLQAYYQMGLATGRYEALLEMQREEGRDTSKEDTGDRVHARSTNPTADII